jgi:hypothetical protein
MAQAVQPLAAAVAAGQPLARRSFIRVLRQADTTAVMVKRNFI